MIEMKTKKILFILVAMLLFSLVACDDTGSQTNTPPDTGIQDTIQNLLDKYEQSGVIKYPAGSSYELSEGASYNYSGASPVSYLTYGRKTMGTFYIIGNFNEESTYQDKFAYGTEETISFGYYYDGAYQTDVLENYNILADESTVVAGSTLSGSISKGALIVQKSYDGINWMDAANPVVNFFESNPAGVDGFYTTSGDDIKHGTFYRVTIAYKTGMKVDEKGILFWKEDVFDARENVEVYEFFICHNSGIISIHNLALEPSDFETDELDYETMVKGETLLDGSTTTKGFSIDKLGTTYDVLVQKNNEEAALVADGTQFIEPGRYTITTTTKLGKQSVQTVYIFDCSDDNGYKTYFGDNFINGKRMFRYTDYSVYDANTKIILQNISEFVPALRGYILNLKTNEKIEITGDNRSKQEFSLPIGEYICEFYNGLDTAGTICHYTFRFIITDEEAGPYVNYDNLNKTDRFEDFAAKHYEVAYQTAGGGYIFVCFSLDSYQEAFNYAYEIEKRFIEQAKDGLYYKSIDNPNVKVKYVDYVDMTEALNKYASENVEVAYFNATDEFTFRTYNNDLLENLESLSLRESIKVFPSEEEKQKLIDRQPFINNFTFIQAADYDVIKVEAYCKATGTTYTLEFGKDVNEQLTVSSVYTITETSVYGDVRTYDVVFVFDNTIISDWNVTTNGKTETITISKDNAGDNKYTINADSVSIKNIKNEFDEHSIVTIKAPTVHSVEIKCSITEFKNMGLYEKGQYEISFIDRLGNSYSITINISGNMTYADAITSSNLKSYTEFYNAIQLSAAKNNNNNNQQQDPNNNPPSTDDFDDDITSDSKKSSDKLPWWAILLISIGALIVLFIATACAIDGAEGWIWIMWVVSILALVLMFIFTSWAWWILSLVELGIIIGTAIISFVIGENSNEDYQ